MSDVVVQANRVSKEYRINRFQRKKTHERSLRDDVVGWLTSPFRKRDDSGSLDSIWALKDVSFDVKAGEVVGIIGRNGAGKSTLLKILSRITRPTEGTIDIYGRVGSLLEVGTGFHAELSGRENIYLNGAILGMGKREIDRKFDEIVAFSEVEKFIDTPVKRYSSGMYMRLAFAVAAHLDPEILIVDEVLAVGDVQFQKKCLGKMSEVAHGGRTVLFVSHNMNAIEQLCGSAILLEQGTLVEYSHDVSSVISRYLSDAVDETTSPFVWVNAGNTFDNPYLKPLKMSLTNADGDPIGGVVNRRDVVWLQIEAEIKRLDSALIFGYAIYGESGTPLYWSLQTDAPQEQWLKIKEGRWVFRSRIPLEVLNEGHYRLELIAGLYYVTWFCAPGEKGPVVYLDVQGGLSDSPYWVSKRPGVMAISTEWVGDLK
ncbi:MAG: polysaccharide ABC transporter ATP-binding protein [Chloroflexota bacterium]